MALPVQEFRLRFPDAIIPPPPANRSNSAIALEMLKERVDVLVKTIGYGCKWITIVGPRLGAYVPKQCGEIAKEMGSIKSLLTAQGIFETTEKMRRAFNQFYSTPSLLASRS